MNIIFITNFCEGFMVSKIPKVSVFGYLPLYIYYNKCTLNIIQCTCTL